MAELVKPWNDGGSLSVAYEGDGDGSAVFSSDAYEGIDRTQIVVFRDGDKSVAVERTVRQEGTRQPFRLAGGGIFRLANGGRFGVLKEGGVVPPTPVETYTRLTYLESTGAQYINTGYVVQEDDVIEMYYTKPVRTTVEEYMFGASDGNGRVFAYINSNSIYPRFGGDTKSAFSSTRWKNVMTLQKGSVDFDGTTGELGYVSLAQVPLYLFARNNNGTAAGFSTIKSTGLTITKTSGEVALKLRPCMRDSDGAIGMIDLVSGRFCENLGTEEFLYGGGARTPEGYEILDYLAFNNDRVFDTGVYGNENTYIELLFRRTDTSGADYIFGTSSGSRMTGYLTSSGYWRYGNGAPTFNTNNLLLHYASVSPGTTLIDDTTRTFTVGSAFTTAFTIPVGGYKPSSGVASATYQGHLYYFRMWHGDEVVVDYMPCKRLSDGVEGFWDCVTQTFIESL
jgi:hypothetical protein